MTYKAIEMTRLTDSQEPYRAIADTIRPLSSNPKTRRGLSRYGPNEIGLLLLNISTQEAHGPLTMELPRVVDSMSDSRKLE